ncbi:energy transducer TonB [Pyxidicoccus sp. 3LFB2]
MRHPLVALSFLFLLTAGCRHANIPQLPASHGQLSRMMQRHLRDAPEPDDLTEGALPSRRDPKAPTLVVEPAQAPAVLAEAIQVLEGRPTEEQLKQAMADVYAACNAPFPPACDALRDRWTNPRRLAFESPTFSEEALRMNAKAIVVIECMLTTQGLARDCKVLERAPYGITEAMLQATASARYQPATFFGHPIEVAYSFLFRLHMTRDELTPEQQIGWARARVARFPASAPAWSHLANALAKYAPEDPDHPKALRALHTLLPEYWWPANELAWLHVQAGRHAEAEPLQKIALQEAPLNPYVLETAAAVLAGLGRCQEAVPHQQRAVAALPKAWPAPERERFQRTLQDYRQRCLDAVLAPAR